MLGVGDGLEEVLITRGPTAVFVRTGALAVETNGEFSHERHQIDSTTTSWRHESPMSYS